MKLNLGRALWKPHQSFSNCFRSFLLANQLAFRYGSCRALREAIAEEALQPVKSKHSMRDLFILFLEDRVPTAFAQMDRHHVIRRNCRRCAQRVFHSELYDRVPWLMSCPLHPEEPLVEACPHCGHAWDWIVVYNDCPVCGCALSADALIRQGAFDIAPSERLACLVTMLTASDPDNRIVPHNPRATGLNSCPWAHRLFPSIMATHDQRYKTALEQWHVPLFPCKTFTFTTRTKTRKKDARVRDFRTGFDANNTLETVSHLIGHFVAQYCDCGVAASTMPLTVPYRRRCAVCRAFRLWTLWMRETNRRPTSGALRRYYAKRYGSDFPPKPTPSESVYLHQPNAHYALPRHVKEMMYTLALWRGYRFFLHSLNARHDSNNNQQTARMPRQSLPTGVDLTPEVTLGIFAERNHRVSLVIPEWLTGAGNPMPTLPLFMVPIYPFAWILQSVTTGEWQWDSVLGTRHDPQVASRVNTHVDRCELGRLGSSFDGDTRHEPSARPPP